MSVYLSLHVIANGYDGMVSELQKLHDLTIHDLHRSLRHRAQALGGGGASEDVRTWEGGYGRVHSAVQ